jgi:hypothetical protein
MTHPIGTEPIAQPPSWLVIGMAALATLATIIATWTGVLF